MYLIFQLIIFLVTTSLAWNPTKMQLLMEEMEETAHTMNLTVQIWNTFSKENSCKIIWMLFKINIYYVVLYFELSGCIFKLCSEYLDSKISYF